jgi:SAM-dependent methyltransferase
VVAVDPSEKMLAEAKRKSPAGVRFLRGSGEDVPLDAAAVDLVFISMVFHHFKDPRKAAAECRRVVRDDGAVCIRAGCTDRIASYAYVPFFPSTPGILRRSLRSVAFLTAVFEDAGFRLDRHEVIASQAGEDWTGYAERLAHRADSILIQLTDAEFENGLAALRLHAAAQTPGTPVMEPVDFLVFRPLQWCEPNR